MGSPAPASEPAASVVPSPVIASAHGVLGAHQYQQEFLTETLGAMLVDATGRDLALLRRVHANSTVRTRNLALPVGDYGDLGGFGGANDAWIRVGTELGLAAISGALAAAGLAPSDVDVLLSTTVTGVATPGLDARLAPLLGLREDVRRVPLFGLGCVGGAAGLARLRDLIAGDPWAVGVLLSVELCSLTLQFQDLSPANLVASGLFGDGAAAVVLVGAARAAGLGLTGPSVVASRSHLYPDTQHVMGWDVSGTGLKVVLSADVAPVVRDNLGASVSALLEPHDLKSVDVVRWIAHPGGPKVIDAAIEALELSADALDLTRESLSTIGNLSSASVLHVLADTLRVYPAGAGDPAMLFAMGPGFCSETVLLRW